MAANPVYKILATFLAILMISSLAGCTGLSTTPAPTATTTPIDTGLPIKTQTAPRTLTPPTSPVNTLAPTKTQDPIEPIKPTREPSSPVKTLAQTITPDQLELVTPTRKPSPTATWAPYPTPDLYSLSAISILDECRAVVDGLHDLKIDLDLMWPPEHLFEETPYMQGTDFNPNAYFNVLTHLKMAEGYKLSYVYSVDELGGMPQLYARKSNRVQFQSYDEFLESFGEAESKVSSFSTPNHQYDYLEKIRLTKSPESYFELLILALLGDHFYLWWHAGYHDAIIFCDPTDLKAVDSDLQYYDLELPEYVRDGMGEIDFKPVVIIDESTVTVRFVSFTKWGGFYENVYVMEKDNPLQLIDEQHNQLIEYDCGMRF